MPRDQKKPKVTDRPARVVRGGGGVGVMSDLFSRRAGAVQGKVGNQGHDARLQGAANQRDGLIQLIGQRLQTIHGVQQDELLEMDEQRDWYKEVAKGVDGFHNPDPTRWHDAARYYTEASFALCQGNLGRGAQLLEKGMEAERAAYDSLPVQVRERLDRNQREEEMSQPSGMGTLAAAASCPSRDLPDEIQIADRILSITRQLPQGPPLPRLRLGGWWEQEAEEEEEDEG